MGGPDEATTNFCEEDEDSSSSLFGLTPDDMSAPKAEICSGNSGGKCKRKMEGEQAQVVDPKETEEISWLSSDNDLTPPPIAKRVDNKMKQYGMDTALSRSEQLRTPRKKKNCYSVPKGSKR